jgi:hypothetical protein
MELASVTRDVKSIRARRRSRRIIYRVEDEYDTRFDFSPRSTARPLAQAQLGRLIESVDTSDSSGPYIWAIMGWDDVDPDFISLCSDFYPELSQRWELRLEQRIQELQKQCDQRAV